MTREETLVHVLRELYLATLPATPVDRLLKAQQQARAVLSDAEILSPGRPKACKCQEWCPIHDA